MTAEIAKQGNLVLGSKIEKVSREEVDVALQLDALEFEDVLDGARDPKARPRRVVASEDHKVIDTKAPLRIFIKPLRTGPDLVELRLHRIGDEVQVAHVHFVEVGNAKVVERLLLSRFWSGGRQLAVKGKIQTRAPHDIGEAAGKLDGGRAKSNKLAD
jgi:hypothetical protein